MPRILVVDDDTDFCLFVQTALEQAGYEVDAANSGAQALKSLQIYSPDIILMDVKMPDINGLELLPQIKQVSSRSTVLVITAVNNYQIADLLYEAGAEGYLTKPIHLGELVAAVGRSIDNRTSAR